MNLPLLPLNTDVRVFLTLVLLCVMSTIHSQVTVTGSSGADGSYLNLKSAFDALNRNITQTDKDIIITISASTNETYAAVLNGPIKSWNSLKIYPTNANVSITGSLASPLIDLNGAKNVTIDGRVNMTGSTKELSIINRSYTNNAFISTIRFINDASNNRIQYCNIQGSETSSSSGVIMFGTSTMKNGNDNNLIDNNNISAFEASGRPANIIYSLGSGTKTNDNLIISNNNIYNFLNPTIPSTGVTFASNTNECTVIGNSFYETSTFAPTKALNYTIIKVDNKSGSGFTISGNYIGGQEERCGGDVWLKANRQNNDFIAIYLDTGNSKWNSIQNNTIKNFDWMNTGIVTWCGIHILGGNVTIGNEAGNAIGSPSLGTINVRGESGMLTFYGILVASINNVICQNNMIESVVLENTSNDASNFFGICTSKGVGTTNISNNKIGNLTIANSIISSARSLSNPQKVYGIYNESNGIITINNNTIANLTNGTENTNLATKGVINGITTIAGKNTISNNEICCLNIANANNASTYEASVGGIVHTTTALTASISSNFIHHISNTYASFIGNLYGLYFSGGSIGNSVSDNSIYNLSSSASTAANITGIYYDTEINTNTLSGNTIHDLSLPNSASTSDFNIVGVSFKAGIASNNIIIKNFIHGFYTNVTSIAGSLYGVKIISGASTLSNNLIFFGGNVNTAIVGFYDVGAVLQTCNLFHNTVYLSGRQTMGGNHTYALYSASGLNRRNFSNNIFFNDFTSIGSSGKHFAAYLAYTVNTNLTIDNNDYYAPGSGGVLAYHSIGQYDVSNDKIDLNAWRLATGQDNNSKNVDPCFMYAGGANTPDYQLKYYLPASIGNLAVVDFDGNPRLKSPNMGAWEYTGNRWKGTLNSNWSLPGNWTQTEVLSPLSDLVFDENALNDCVLDQDRSIHGVYNSTSKHLTINQHKLTVGGTIMQTMNGPINALGINSTIEFNGTSPQSIVANQFTNEAINTLIANNPLGVMIDTNLEVGNLIVNNGAMITIPEQKQLKVSGVTTNNAGTIGIVIQSSANGTGAFIHNSNNVPATVHRYIGSADSWKFLASPIAAQSISNDWTPNGTYAAGLGYDLFVYDEKSACWIWNQNTTTATNWTNVHAPSFFIPGKGYLYALQSNNQTKVFEGVLNNGDVVVPVDLMSSDLTKKGFNLVGNPYSSSIDWKSDNGFSRSMLENINGGYDSWIWNATANNYGVYNSGSSREEGTNGVSRYIAPMQAFFIKAVSSGDFTFKNSSRTNQGANDWLKAPAPPINNELMLTVRSAYYGSDEIKIAFDNETNSGGAFKFFSPVSTAPSLYLPFNKSLYSVCYLTDTIENKSFQVGFRAGAPGEYVLQCSTNYSISDHLYLVDKKTGLTHSFGESLNFQFSAENTEMSNRFEIYFNSIGFSQAMLNAKVFLKDKLLIVDLSSSNGDCLMRLHDLSGRVLKVHQMMGGDKLSIPLAFKGVYVVSLISSISGRFEYKVIY